MKLGELVSWLSSQDLTQQVRNGFSAYSIIDGNTIFYRTDFVVGLDYMFNLSTLALKDAGCDSEVFYKDSDSTLPRKFTNYELHRLGGGDVLYRLADAARACFRHDKRPMSELSEEEVKDFMNLLNVLAEVDNH